MNRIGMELRFLIAILMAIVLPTAVIGQTGRLDAAELYNEGTKAYEKGDMATAVYNLELAHMLAPRDQEIIHNLRIAKSKVEIDIVEIDPFFLKKWLISAADLFSPGVWRYFTLVLLVGVLALLYRRLIVGQTGGLSSWFSIINVCLLTLMTVGLGITRQQVLTDGRYGVIISETTTFKEGPDPVSEDVKQVSAGVKVEILDRIDDWYKLAAMDREQGWLPQDQVKVLVVN